MIVKFFAGVEAEDQNISPRDPDNAVQGGAVGLKLVVESWLDVSPLWFLSADAAYGTAFQQYWSLARVGRCFGPRLSLGLEGGAGRGGGSVIADLRAVEVTLSGGFTGNYLEDEPSGYVSLGVYRAFLRLAEVHCRPRFRQCWPHRRSVRRRLDNLFGLAGDAPTLIVCILCQRACRIAQARISPNTRMTQRRQQSKREFTLPHIFLSMSRGGSRHEFSCHA
jgi:Cellulose biosynthesis protein BcsS